ncbi:hypothetical protein CDL15_Pgr016188 [Punica granatum]|uniref:DOG1 domain-containing protein n=1 Tax=Punica granatum TaxID=22663 RepID=A0A218X0H0_PUNGR|nr:hypothetical protein CDL15_Pgr016188 [Punica granatum]
MPIHVEKSRVGSTSGTGGTDRRGTKPRLLHPITQSGRDWLSIKDIAENEKGSLNGMPSFDSHLPLSDTNSAESTIQPHCISDFGERDQSAGLPLQNSVNCSQSQKGQSLNLVSIPRSNIENWGESNMADASPRTDISTDDTDDKNQRAIGASDSSDRSKDKTDQKTLRRLAQNREAARKSRLRKKGIFISSSGDQAHAIGGNGAMAFDAEYARWLEDQNKKINELRSAVTAHASDTELRIIVDGVTAHYDEIFRLKGNAAKNDVFHLLSGMWKTPAERCFLWLGGFRPSELLKLLVNQLEPLTEQQVVSIRNLQQSSQQAEDALSQGMEALQQSLAETLSNGSLGNSGSSGNVANYMGQMAMAMGKLGTLEGFIRQADNLRQQTLQQMHRTLTTRQSARAILAIHDYFFRLRALSALWLARPRE